MNRFGILSDSFAKSSNKPSVSNVTVCVEGVGTYRVITPLSTGACIWTAPVSWRVTLKLMLNTMKPLTNSRLFNTLMRLRPGVRQTYRPWLDDTRMQSGKKMSSRTKITLAWADNRQRHRIIDLAAEAGLQTTSLRNLPQAKLVMLRCEDGRIAGWAGMDVETDPEHPEVFSGFVYPEFRRLGLGALLEHVWWAYISAWGCKTAFMRMECGSGQRLVSYWLETGYCRQASDSRLSRQFTGACHICDLFGAACAGNSYLMVDVEKALTASIQRTGPLDICRLPIRFSIETPQVLPTHDSSVTFEMNSLPETQG